MRDYEKYAGISFSKRAIQQSVLDHKPPTDSNATNLSDEEFDSKLLHIFKHCIDISYNQVPEKDYKFWVVAFHDDNDDTIFRKDADISEIKRLMKDADKYCKIWREFNTKAKPKKWVVWPYSESKGWCDRISGEL